MTFHQYAIITVLIFTFAFFVWGRWRYDIVALLALFSCVLLGLVEPKEVFSGFGHPATITVALILTLSFCLTRSGSTELLTGLIRPLENFPHLQLGGLIFLAAFLSMFLNNVGALGLIMPIAMSSSLALRKSPSLVLMPISFGSILGGMVTLIGTPPNIIVSMYRQKVIGQSFSMFDFSYVGATVSLCGLLFLVVIGYRLVRVRKKSSSASQDIFEIESYLFQLKVPKKSSILGKTLKDIQTTLDDLNLSIISLVHQPQHYSVLPKNHVFQEKDLLLVEGAGASVDSFSHKFGLSLVSADSSKTEIFHSNKTAMQEVVITHESRLKGKKVGNIRFKSYYNINLLAIYREGEVFRSKLSNFKLSTGDVLLLYGDKENLEDSIPRLGCFPLMKRNIDFGKKKYSLLALLIFISSISLSVFNVFPIQVALLFALLFMFFINIISAEDFYDNVEWPVIVLLAAMIPVGQALEDTGTTKLLADSLLDVLKNQSLPVVLTILLIITMSLSDILNNAATAILMLPIAKDMAIALNASIDAFFMIVAIGASCAFLTPIGHQNNAIVMGPGGYRFRDYWPLGLPLEILIILVAVPLTINIWA